ncbi:hypothetical protein [Aquimarina litoralis]|uniref:hypothetical protein n=1 Tax=Aquimarina litoralis TaxID=584605 RepID=UPI001C56DB57|nr:hypothetical protein [Aquimarina litoralis]MBW1294999.1 hypothetical protein [Aquimarina litoralis]
MTRISYFIIFFLTFNSCASYQKNEILELIVRNEFLDPPKAYDMLIEDFVKTGLIDSLKIIGRPISIPKLEFEIDTLRIHQMGISMSLIQENLKKIDPSKGIDEIIHQYITTESGQEIPLSAVCKAYLKAGYYKPEIFASIPETYYYKDEKVVKIVFYPKKDNTKRLIEFTNEYFNMGANKKWDIEIIN